MSYDILILDPHPRFKDGDEFISWYDEVTQWNEGGGFERIIITMINSIAPRYWSELDITLFNIKF